MSVKFGQRQFIIFGVLFLIFGILFTAASITKGVFPMGHDIIQFAVSVMAFCNAYLYPHFREKDERAKRIREKGMFVSYFFILGYMLVLMALFQFNLLTLDGYQTVSVMAALTMTTVFVSFVVFARRS
ncbi:hypothetical protein [Sediminibacillus albus]|uniref:Permease n=1 Tax=Sediminibacillus albus TaxID=407036 RepID=A0A1G8ZUK5_9BACI|nr:hypothetical protein [Sediminibacillus albus]SDK18691.1 hypothetical protein SAMN05216243_2231 [Sediminibacillus albus]